MYVFVVGSVFCCSLRRPEEVLELYLFLNVQMINNIQIIDKF